MSGAPPPGTPPPEVPEEFAAAYRAAYLRALAAQTDAPRHVAQDDEDEQRDQDDQDDDDEPAPADRDSWAHRLPERAGRLLEGTHRDEREEARKPGSSGRRSLTDERWFVPLLLALIVLLLVVGAYALGRVVAASLGS